MPPGGKEPNCLPRMHPGKKFLNYACVAPCRNECVLQGASNPVEFIFILHKSK
jgi:hypothetical protein